MTLPQPSDMSLSCGGVLPAIQFLFFFFGAEIKWKGIKIKFKNAMSEMENFGSFEKNIVILQRTFDIYNYTVNKIILN